MPNFLFFSIVLSSSIFMTGCVSSLPPRPWFEGEKDWPTVVQYEIELDGKKMPIQFSYHISCAYEESLWISVYIHNFSRHVTDINTRYYPENAYIIKENGERVPSEPELYRSLPTQKVHKDREFTAHCKNDTAWFYSEVGKENLKLNSSGVLYRFNTSAPIFNSRWKLNLGSISIEDKGISIPEKFIILRTKQFYLQKIQ